MDHYAARADIASHMWNMQKSLISIGMILVMLEEQVSNNEWLALHDELTGLPNRRLFAARLTGAIEYCDRRSTSLALVVLDLNDFKKINDTLGHVAGDQVLREVATTLRKSIRATDTVARLGGDEFIIVATDMANERSVERFTDSLRSAIERPMTINDRGDGGGRELRVRHVSAGREGRDQAAAAGGPADVSPEAEAGGSGATGDGAGGCGAALGVSRFVTRIGLRVVLPRAADRMLC